MVALLRLNWLWTKRLNRLLGFGWRCRSPVVVGAEIRRVKVVRVVVVREWEVVCAVAISVVKRLMRIGRLGTLLLLLNVLIQHGRSIVTRRVWLVKVRRSQTNLNKKSIRVGNNRPQKVPRFWPARELLAEAHDGTGVHQQRCFVEQLRIQTANLRRKQPVRCLKRIQQHRLWRSTACSDAVNRDISLTKNFQKHWFGLGRDRFWVVR